MMAELETVDDATQTAFQTMRWTRTRVSTHDSRSRRRSSCAASSASAGGDSRSGGGGGGTPCINIRRPGEMTTPATAPDDCLQPAADHAVAPWTPDAPPRWNSNRTAAKNKGAFVFFHSLPPAREWDSGRLRRIQYSGQSDWKPDSYPLCI